MTRTGNIDGHGGAAGQPAAEPPAGQPPAAQLAAAEPAAGSGAANESWPQLILLVISVCLSLFSASAYISRPPDESLTSVPALMYPTGIAFIAALAASSFLLAKQWKHTVQIIRYIVMGLFSIQLVVTITATINGQISAPNFSTLLAVVTFGFSGLVIALCVLALLWMRHWRQYTEAITLGVFGVVVTLLCLPGMRFVTKPLASPDVMTSGVYLFATGGPTERLSLDVALNPTSYDYILPNRNLSYSNEESFTIYNGSNHAIQWAVLLDNDARLKTFEHVPTEIAHRPVSIDADWSGSIVSDPNGYETTPAQLFTGRLAGNSSSSFFGTVMGTFETTTISRAQAYLPTYSQVSLSRVRSTKNTELIKKALGGAPTARNSKAFAITLTAGEYNPSLQSVSDTQPSADPTLQSEGVVRWTGHVSIFNPQYKLFSQNGADLATAGLFIFAIFLGVAGASILAGLQCVVKILLSREQ
jgi:hypothetical protein